MMKNLKYIIVSAISMITQLSFAYDFEVKGIYYNINIEEKTAEVTRGTLSGTPTYIGDIVIPSTVTYANQELPVIGISNQAFWGCSELLSIEIPNTVESIGYGAFYMCTNLTSIKIPDLVTTIADRTFEKCENLSIIEIPSSVKLIGERAFSGCSSLVSIVIPSSVESIGASAFANCTNLTSIEIPYLVTTINDLTFENCENLSIIEIPSSVNSLGESAFKGCSSLNSIVIPNSIISIGAKCFKGCNNLTNLIFEDGKNDLNFESYYVYESRTWYQYETFDKCNIKNIYIGRNFQYEESYYTRYYPFSDISSYIVISIGKDVKEIVGISTKYCMNLKAINFYSSEPPLETSTEFTNTQYAEILVNVPDGALKAYQENKIWGEFWNLQVSPPYQYVFPDEIILNIESAELNIGETLQIEATVLPEETADPTLTWNSSNENIATISEEGLVTAISAGEATISATCGDVSATCEIIVMTDEIPENPDDTGIDSLFANPESKISIFTNDGILIKKDCKVEDLKTLNKGIYIIVSGDNSYKINL